MNDRQVFSKLAPPSGMLSLTPCGIRTRTIPILALACFHHTAAPVSYPGDSLFPAQRICSMSSVAPGLWGIGITMLSSGLCICRQCSIISVHSVCDRILLLDEFYYLMIFLSNRGLSLAASSPTWTLCDISVPKGQIPIHNLVVVGLDW